MQMVVAFIQNRNVEITKNKFEKLVNSMKIDFYLPA